MHFAYRPTPQQIADALKLLGYDTDFEDGEAGEEDYPELCGQLLALAEITHCNVVGNDKGELIKAYQEIFLETDSSYDEDDDRQKWQDYQTALRETGDRLQFLHATVPHVDHDPLDHPIGDAAHAAGWLAMRLANLRLALSMRMAEPKLEFGLQRQLSEMISEAARVIAVLSSVMNPAMQHVHTPESHHDDEDLCDFHREEMASTLQGIEAATEAAKEEELENAIDDTYYEDVKKVLDELVEVGMFTSWEEYEDGSTDMFRLHGRANPVELEFFEALDWAHGVIYTHDQLKETPVDEDERPRYVQKDLGDDYYQVMTELLDRMQAEGHITEWEHQPLNGNSIWLMQDEQPAKCLGYDEALEYARGFLDAIDQLKEKD